jgi:hypothetical protein
MSLFVQDFFINNTMISLNAGNYEHIELTVGDVQWIFGHYNKSRVKKNIDVWGNIKQELPVL